MDRERESIRNKLDEELRELKFERAEDVIRRVHPRTWRERLSGIWNKEIEVPVLPLGMSFAVILAVVAVSHLRTSGDEGKSGRNGEERQLIEAGGNTYWKDEYERAVAAIEAEGQS